MAANFSDILRNWIPEALDGNIEYFKQLKKHHILGQCKDKYGMTPLMYAVLGRGCFDRNLLSEFAKLCKKSARNCLGHTACDIYICIADPAVFSDAQYRDIFNVLDPSNTANKEAAANTAADVAAGLFAAGVAAFAAFTYFGADSAQRSNMDAAYRRKAEQARFSSYGTEIMPKDPTAKSEYYRETYTSKFCTEQRDRLSHLEERQNSKEEELARLHTELENLNQSSGAIFREQCRKYAEARLSAYRKEREEQHQRLLNTEEKDEFETQAEFQERIIQMMQKQFGPEASDKELLKVREEDLPGLRVRTKKILGQRQKEIEGEISGCQQDIHTIELQLDLLNIYAFPFFGTCVFLGAYDAENECFTLNIYRYEALIRIPRETARIIRQDSNSYKICYRWDKANLDYNAVFIIQTEDQNFESEAIQCRLLSRAGNRNT